MIASWHRAGQMVVCVDPFEWFVPALPRRLRGLHEGDVYTVGRVLHRPRAEVSPVMFLLIELGAGAPWYPAQRFRPIATPSIECFRALLSPSPTTTKENA